MNETKQQLWHRVQSHIYAHAHDKFHCIEPHISRHFIYRLWNVTDRIQRRISINIIGTTMEKINE